MEKLRKVWLAQGKQAPGRGEKRAQFAWHVEQHSVPQVTFPSLYKESVSEIRVSLGRAQHKQYRKKTDFPKVSALFPLPELSVVLVVISCRVVLFLKTLLCSSFTSLHSEPVGTPREVGCFFNDISLHKIKERKRKTKYKNTNLFCTYVWRFIDLTWVIPKVHGKEKLSLLGLVFHPFIQSVFV